MKCPDCGGVNLPEQASCRYCASALPRVCGHCGFVCDAIARFCGGCGKPLQSAPAAAERRHLTVMFCDMVGSTGLSIRIDPEDLSDVFRQYQQACKQVISRYGGYVARYTGDGVLSYFGYPVATEHDAERAVRAGLDIIQAIRKLKFGPGLSLHTRIGIASGEVVVGEVVGEGASLEVTVVGETPNLAARLQGISAADKVVISGETRKLIGGLFEYSDMGHRSLRGFDEPVHAYTVVGESAVESRFEATHGGRPGSLVGCEKQMLALQESFRRACGGTCQLVTICGEEGIGKSHLLEHFRSSLTSRPVEVIGLYGSPHASGTVLHPVISHWRRFAGIEAGDSSKVKLDKLEARLAQLGSSEAGHLLILATLLSVPSDGRLPTLQMSPSALKLSTLELLVSQVKIRCRSLPVVLAIEDLHWFDATSIEFLNLLVQEARALPLLVVATYRPEYTPRWPAGFASTGIVMTHLESVAARSLILQVCQGKALPESIVADILDKTDGIPLFIEELTRAILESPMLIEQDRGFVLTGNNPLPAIPSTLQDSLRARLDRPGLAKEIAQIAAALGREFRADLLQAVAGKPAELVYPALEELVSAQLVVPWGNPPHQNYRFKHTLIQETAYGSMLRSTRHQLHARIAKTLTQRFRAQVQGRPDLLARHYAAAQLHEEGFRYWFLASQQAQRLFAHKEVAVHLSHGLELAGALPDDVEFIVMEFEMRCMLASTLMVLNGPGHEDVGAAYRRAYEFCGGREGVLDSFPVRFGLCRHLWAIGRIREAVTEAESLLPLADVGRDPGQFMAVHLLLGISLWHRGETERALGCLQQVTACYRAERDAGLFFTYMVDFGVLGRFYEALALLFLGRADEAHLVARESLALARELDNPHVIGFGLMANFMVAIFSGEFEQCIVAADECVRAASSEGFPEFLALAMVCKGSARLKSGLEKGSLDMVRQGVEEWEETGSRAWRPLLRGMLAEAYLLRDQHQQARLELDRARKVMMQQGERQPAQFLSAIEGQLASRRQSP